jgi:hypothetical protein
LNFKAWRERVNNFSLRGPGQAHHHLAGVFARRVNRRGDRLLYAGNNLSKARELFAQASAADQIDDPPADMPARSMAAVGWRAMRA